MQSANVIINDAMADRCMQMLRYAAGHRAAAVGQFTIMDYMLVESTDWRSAKAKWSPLTELSLSLRCSEANLL